MKKIILYIGSAVFAALMVYNIGESNLLTKNTDVSLESIKIMAAGAQSELPPDEPLKWQKLDLPCFDKYGIPTGKYQRICYTGGILESCNTIYC
jgi:hypothetical protein